MGSIAAEFRQKQAESQAPSAVKRAAESLWEYEKLMNPKFFKEERWHLKEIADTLQALVEERIIRTVPELEWRIASPEDVRQLKENGTDYQICKKLKLNIPPRHGRGRKNFCVYGK